MHSFLAPHAHPSAWHQFPMVDSVSSRLWHESGSFFSLPFPPFLTLAWHTRQTLPLSAYTSLLGSLPADWVHPVAPGTPMPVLNLLKFKRMI